MKIRSRVGELPEYVGRIGNGFEKLGKKIPQTKIRDYLCKIPEKAKDGLETYDFSILFGDIWNLLDEATGGPYKGDGREAWEDVKKMSKYFSKFA
ncbi:MAG TPA: hypothetical protein ENI51_06700 [Candidatus Atribacteria bacterium]|nr:hypothetical protein [Candidatus Atribacteria bacterium]